MARRLLQMTPDSSPRLRRQRDFQLLWLGQVISTLGSWVTAIALPLLVLAQTDSPVRTGLASFAFGLPLLLFTLSAGALVDRWNRRTVMLVADAARFVAVASLAIALLLGAFSYPHVLAVAFVEGSGYTFFTVAERASLRRLVPPELLAAAIAQNQARQSAALLAGPPLGGLLFSLGRVVPFAVDAGSYLFSLVMLALIRRPLQEARGPVVRHLRREIGEGLAFLWRKPFLRTTSLLVTGSDLVLNALFLTVVVIARDHGASSTAIGLMTACLGAAGLAGAAVAPALARRLSLRQTVALTMGVPALLVPFLVLATAPLTLGVLYGAMFVLHPTWDASIGSYRLLITPDRLQGRVQSANTLLASAAVPLASLVVGIVLELAGSDVTVAALAALMAFVAVAAVASRAVRDAPPLSEVRA